MRTLLLVMVLATLALAAPPFGVERGHYLLDKEDVWLIVLPQKVPAGVTVVHPFPSDQGKPQPGKLALLVTRQKKLYLLAANEFFSTPIWQEKDVAGNIRVDGKRLAVFTESGADMFILWDGKTFVSVAGNED